MRRKDVEIIASAGSGHPGGSLSIIELMSVLFFGKQMNYDPADPQWADRDRLILSKGHTCPALYIALAYAGFFPKEELETLRLFGSRLQGHTDLNMKTPGVETSGGPLGQGLSVAVGMAIAAMIDERKNVIYTIIGDGESAKGGISEAAKSAGVMKLNNMVAFLDWNKVDQDGAVKDVQPCLFADEWKGYGWYILEAKGDDVEAIWHAIQKAHSVRTEKNVPVIILLDTIKGAGISFMSEAAEHGNSAWHGTAPKNDDLFRALKECDTRITALDTQFPGDIMDYIHSMQLTHKEKTNKEKKEATVSVVPSVTLASCPNYFSEAKATRDAFGEYITALGRTDSRIVAVTAGVAGSVKLDNFAKEFGMFSSMNRHGRFVQVGIAEANMAGVASGLALSGKKPWMATFDIFVKEALGVIRNSICYNNVDVKIIGTHAGLGVEFDGGSHQSTIVPAIMADLFRMECYEPADANETMQLMKLMYEQEKAAYFRLTRQKLPLLNQISYAYGMGARVVHSSANPEAILVASGEGIALAFDTAKQLAKDGISVSIIDVYSLSHLCNDAFRALLPPNIPIVTVHDAHHKILAREIAYSLSQIGRGERIVSLGMREFGESGTAAELYKKHCMDPKNIAKTVMKIVT